MNRWGDAMLCMLVGGVIGTGLLLAMAWPALPPAAHDLSHAFASSRAGDVPNIASPEIERRIATHPLRCNQFNSAIRFGPQIDAKRPPQSIDERSRNGRPSVRHMDESQLLAVKVWFARAVFHASACAVDSDETRVFGEPTDLLHFLCTAGGAPMPTRQWHDEAKLQTKRT